MLPQAALLSPCCGDAPYHFYTRELWFLGISPRCVLASSLPRSAPGFDQDQYRLFRLCALRRAKILLSIQPRTLACLEAETQPDSGSDYYADAHFFSASPGITASLIMQPKRGRGL